MEEAGKEIQFSPELLKKLKERGLMETPENQGKEAGDNLVSLGATQEEVRAKQDEQKRKKAQTDAKNIDIYEKQRNEIGAQIGERTTKFLRILGLVETQGAMKKLFAKVEGRDVPGQIASFAKDIKEMISKGLGIDQIYNTKNAVLRDDTKKEVRSASAAVVGSILDHMDSDTVISPAVRELLAGLSHNLLRFGQEPLDPNKKVDSEVGDHISKVIKKEKTEKDVPWRDALMLYADGRPMSEYKKSDITDVIEKAESTQGGQPELAKAA